MDNSISLEEYIWHKWLYSNQEIVDNLHLLRSIKSKYMFYLKLLLQNDSLCCVRQIKREFLRYKLISSGLKYSPSDRCIFSQTTHVMQLLKPDKVCTNNNDKIYDALQTNFIKMILVNKNKRFCFKVRKDEIIPVKNKNLTRKKRIHYRFWFQNEVNYLKNDCLFNYYLQNGTIDKCWHMCKEREVFYNDLCKKYLKYTNYLKMPMCYEFISPYMMSKPTLYNFDLKNLLIELLLPYALILPYFNSFYPKIISEFQKWNQRKRKWNNKSIDINLQRIYDTDHQRFFAQHFEEEKEVYITSWILSGGIIPYLLKQTSSFRSVDIFVEDIDMWSFYIVSQNVRDFNGELIWNKGTYSNGSNFNNKEAILKRFIYLNPESSFYKHMSEFCGDNFHPPQFFSYSDTSYWKNELMNTNFAKIKRKEKMVYNSFERLARDAYSIMDLFDLPICRNAIIFINGDEYHKEKNKWMNKEFCEEWESNFADLSLVDTFYADSIRINFDNNNDDDDDILDNQNDKEKKRKRNESLFDFGF